MQNRWVLLSVTSDRRQYHMSFLVGYTWMDLRIVGNRPPPNDEPHDAQKAGHVKSQRPTLIQLEITQETGQR